MVPVIHCLPIEGIDSRRRLEAALEHLEDLRQELIAVLDKLDGDADFEPEPDEVDSDFEPEQAW